MRITLFAAVVIFLFGCDTSRNTIDPVENYFVKYFGTDGNQTGADMLVNNDGTILLLGTSYFSDKVRQAYLVKVDGRGEIIWEKFYSSSGSITAMDVEPTIDGHYLILCNEENLSTGTDILVINIDADGNEVASTRGSFTYSNNSDEVGVTVTPVSDNGTPSGYIVGGNTNYDPIPNDNSDNGFEKITALFVRFNSDGTQYDKSWKLHQSSNGEDYCTKVVQVGTLSDPDPFIIFGYTNSNPNNTSFNFWSTRINNLGEGALLDDIIAGSPNGTDERLGSVGIWSKLTPYNNNYLMTGVSSNNSGSDNIFIATNKISLLAAKSITEFSLGNLIGTGNTYLEKVTSYPMNSGFIIAANSVANGNADMLLVKISVSGELIWDAPVILGGAGQDYECSVYVTDDDRILVFGTMSLGDDGQKKMALIKLNENGRFR